MNINVKKLIFHFNKGEGYVLTPAGETAKHEHVLDHASGRRLIVYVNSKYVFHPP